MHEIATHTALFNKQSTCRQIDKVKRGEESSAKDKNYRDLTELKKTRIYIYHIVSMVLTVMVVRNVQEY